MRGLLSSVASRTVIGRAEMALLKSLNLKVDRDPNLHCVVIDGSDREVIGKIQALFRLKDRVIALNVLLVPSLPHTLVLGVDFWTCMGDVLIYVVIVGIFLPFLLIASKLLVNSRLVLSSVPRTLGQAYFSFSASDLGCVKEVEHRIDIESKTLPIKLRNFPISPKLQEIIDREHDSMSNLRLRLGLLPSS